MDSLDGSLILVDRFLLPCVLFRRCHTTIRSVDRLPAQMHPGHFWQRRLPSPSALAALQDSHSRTALFIPFYLVQARDLELPQGQRGGGSELKEGRPQKECCVQV